MSYMPCVQPNLNRLRISIEYNYNNISIISIYYNLNISMDHLDIKKDF